MISIKCNDKELLEVLNRAVSQLQSPRPLMDQIGRFLRDQTKLRFRFGIDPDGIKWAPIKRPGQIGRNTSKLLDYITYVSGESKVAVGTNTKYAPYFHYGTKPHEIKPRIKKALFWKGAKHPVKKVNHPGTVGRPFLGIGEGDRAGTLDLIRKYIGIGPKG